MQVISMFVRAKQHPNSNKTTVLICHSKRYGKKITQLILNKIGYGTTQEEIDELKKIANVELSLLKQKKPQKLDMSQSQVLLKDVKEISRNHVGIKDIFGKLFDELGFNDVLNSKDSEVLKSLILARITEPSSKLRASEILQRKFGLGISVDTIYRLLDKLQANNVAFEQKVFKSTQLVEDSIDLMFFDVTTLYFETCEVDELRNFGYSKDCKFNTTQVVLALATTREGLPIGYKLFPGNTGEVSTLVECVNSWKQFLKIDKVIFVADRGMMSKENLEAIEKNNMSFIVACPLRKLPATTKKLVLDGTDYTLQGVDEKTVSWIKEIDLTAKKEASNDPPIDIKQNINNGDCENDPPVEENNSKRRLIITYNSKRHTKDQSDREKILEKIKKRLGKQPKAKKLISNKGYIKFTTVDEESIAELNSTKIEEDQKWDGLHGVLTNVDLKAVEAVRRYKHLWVIEESFRINKHNLQMRPIYHYSARRIKSHILLCYLTFTLLRHAQYRLKKFNIDMSITELRDELIDVQASILCDKTSGQLFKMPSAVSENVKMVYEVFNTQLVGTLENYE